ncbi:hypothetical protein RHGRI_023580 [Rhododendron griersonianum]|uniref:Uncharacterized protein n=1 Tax=Rhododendron griersonianum TaxID=479676 RepID=A0AAV6J465_9ERIC|nr:hypothetical protein RHGRI_023580 [Rhododendron griersonianum]
MADIYGDIRPRQIDEFGNPVIPTGSLSLWHSRHRTRWFLSSSSSRRRRQHPHHRLRPPPLHLSLGIEASSEFVMSFSSSVMKCSACFVHPTSSTTSILDSGP